MARNQMRLDDETAEMVEKVRKWQRSQGIETSEAGAARLLLRWGFREWLRLHPEVAATHARKGGRNG